MAVIAVTCDVFAFKRKTWKSITFSAGGNLITLADYVIGLAACGVLCVLMSLSVGMFFLWALFYFASAVCAYIDSIHDSSANSFSFPALGNIL